jgi:hypothetical protein
LLKSGFPERQVDKVCKSGLCRDRGFEHEISSEYSASGPAWGHTSAQGFQTVAACSEKPASRASSGLFGTSSSGGTLHSVRALRPALGPMAMR